MLKGVGAKRSLQRGSCGETFGWGLGDRVDAQGTTKSQCAGLHWRAQLMSTGRVARFKARSRDQPPLSSSLHTQFTPRPPCLPLFLSQDAEKPQGARSLSQPHVSPPPAESAAFPYLSHLRVSLLLLLESSHCFISSYGTTPLCFSIDMEPRLCVSL